MNKTERRKAVTSVPIQYLMPWADYLKIKRERVCSGCGGKLTIYTDNVWPCGNPDKPVARFYRLACWGDNCYRIENGVDPKVWRKVRKLVLKNHLRAYDYQIEKRVEKKSGGWRYVRDQYALAQITRYYCDLYDDFKRAGL